MRDRGQRMRVRTLAAVLAVSCGSAAFADSLTREQSLERLVRQDCGSCHGMTLKGGLGPALESERMMARDPAALAAIILDGVPGTPMPPWRGLMTDADALWIAHYLRKEAVP